MSSISVRLVRKPAILLADGTLGGDVRLAPTVVEASLPSERAALLRARAELDAGGVQRVPMSATIAASGHLMPGTIGQLIDSERGPVPAKLTAITYTLSLGDDRTITADAQITVERLDD